MSPASKEKKRQLSLALASLSMKEDRRQKLVGDGALKTLAEMSQLPDPVVRRACAAAMARLSLDFSAYLCSCSFTTESLGS